MPKILIIEDRRENIVFIANNILKPLGYEVITAMDGQSGLAKAQEETPDLIISDLKLPGLGGLEVMEQLHHKGIHIPTIVMTFHGTEETAVQALRLGARDYLIKPFTIEEMQAALDRALKPATPVPKLQPLPSAHPKESTSDPDKAAKLEQELLQIRQALRTRDKQVNQLQQLLTNRIQQPEANRPPLNPATAEERIAQLEHELIQMRAVLAAREKQLVQLQQLTNSAKKVEMAEVAQRAATWEEDNARLNQALAQTKQTLAEAEKRIGGLEEIVLAQKVQLGKSQEEAKRLADQLRNASEGLRLLAQDLGQQVERVSAFTLREKK